ncbi:hypothetical protein DFH06DRAFT_1343424 [Mycena polygramma]|nr:hypothetical protein DFH06DRAFT_1343424 [Mycena polygramma]
MGCVIGACLSASRYAALSEGALTDALLRRRSRTPDTIPRLSFPPPEGSSLSSISALLSFLILLFLFTDLTEQTGHAESDCRIADLEYATGVPIVPTRYLNLNTTPRRGPPRIELWSRETSAPRNLRISIPARPIIADTSRSPARTHIPDLMLVSSAPTA